MMDKGIEQLSLEMDCLSIDNDAHKLNVDNNYTAEKSLNNSLCKLNSNKTDNSKFDLSKHGSTSTKEEYLRRTEEANYKNAEQNYLLFLNDPTISLSKENSSKTNEEFINKAAFDQLKHQNSDCKSMLMRDNSLIKEFSLMKEDSMSKREDNLIIEGDISIIKQEESALKNDYTMKKEDSNRNMGDSQKDIISFLKKEDSVSGCNHLFKENSISSVGSYIFSLPRLREDSFLQYQHDTYEGKMFRISATNKYRLLDSKISHLLTLYKKWADISTFFVESDWPIAYKRYLILYAKKDQTDGWNAKVSGYISVLRAQAELLRNCLTIIEGKSKKTSINI
jgi:HD-GYP domain-containing protein (c-di-GMP phosphodiesterase class II)